MITKCQMSVLLLECKCATKGQLYSKPFTLKAAASLSSGSGGRETQSSPSLPVFCTQLHRNSCPPRRSEATPHYEIAYHKAYIIPM